MFYYFIQRTQINYLIEISLIHEEVRVEIITHIFYVRKARQREVQSFT